MLLPQHLEGSWFPQAAPYFFPRILLTSTISFWKMFQGWQRATSSSKNFNEACGFTVLHQHFRAGAAALLTGLFINSAFPGTSVLQFLLLPTEPPFTPDLHFEDIIAPLKWQLWTLHANVSDLFFSQAGMEQWSSATFFCSFPELGKIPEENYQFSFQRVTG